jgi:hypothetical protein
VAAVFAFACLAFLGFSVASESAQAGGSAIYTYVDRPNTTQAGGHPDIFTEYKMGTWATQPEKPDCLCNTPKQLIHDFPTGVIGNPHATPQCDAVALALQSCPIDSQVGVVAILPAGELGSATAYIPYAVYNIVPQSGQAGLFAFTVLGTAILTELSARTGSDYGLQARTIGLQRDFTPYGVSLYLWGVPASPIHDQLRAGAFGQGTTVFCALDIGDPRPYFERNEIPPESECPPFTEPHSSSSPQVPFLSNPTACEGPLTTEFETLAYDHVRTRKAIPFPAITGCDQLSFNPSLSAKPTTTYVDSASGLDVNLSVPQFSSALTPSPSEIRATTVTLPRGFSINPNAADGKTTCSDVEASFGTEAEAHCPETAKVGTTSVESSALPAPIPGFLYLGEPRPGNRYRVILTADGFATHVKLAGSAIPDPQTGQLTFSFPDLPQSPLTNFNLHVFGSERGILATPTQCGTYAVHSTFTPWDAALADQSATQFFVLDHGPDGAPCPSSPRRLSPGFRAASLGNTAAAHSPFAVELSRQDGDQNLSGLKVTTPPGFAATLKGIPYCSDAAIATLNSSGYTGRSELASPACPAASQVGSAVAGAGSGSRPLYVGGKVYLAGPYKGAPLSLVVVVPAVSGPYDLGNVAVRVALRVDSLTAQVTAISDPLPQILEGVPLRTRFIQVNLDRRNFTLNPTNCDPFSVRATVGGDEGGSATVESPFQVANCARLPFKPHLDIRLTGGVKRRGHPAIHAMVTATPGEANIASTSVTLPGGELLDNSHFGSICTIPDFTSRSCPSRSLIGHATAISPILDQPLTGNVYLRSSRVHDLPDMAIDLSGQVDFTLLGHIDSVNARLRTRFETVPDVPISKFTLDLLGGSKGLLQNSEDLCGGVKHLKVKMVGQNGAVSKSRPTLRVICGKKGRRR